MRSASPPRPHDAASLVVVRGRGADRRVLLGRREARSRFMPSLFVFPGGRVDPEDGTRPVRHELPVAVRRWLARRWGAERARALATAAIRETHEETGLLIGDERRGTWRPDHAGLDYLGRAITPTSSPIRFHARFFLLHQPRHPTRGIRQGLRGNGELEDLGWYTFDQALGLPMLDVTRHVLAAARRTTSGGTATSANPARRRLYIHYRGEHALVRCED